MPAAICASVQSRMAAERAAPQPAAPDRPLLVQQLQQACAGLLQLGQGKREQAQVVVVLPLGVGIAKAVDAAIKNPGSQKNQGG